MKRLFPKQSYSNPPVFPLCVVAIFTTKFSMKEENQRKKYQVYEHTDSDLLYVILVSFDCSELVK